MALIFLILKFRFFFQAELKEKDRLRDEAKKLKRLETSFRTLLSDKFGEDITPESQWEDIVGKIENESAFKAVTGRAILPLPGSSSRQLSPELSNRARVASVG